MDLRRDPRASLSTPPDPWAGSETPSRRDGPPYHMTEMILAEPALAGRVLGRLADPSGPAAHLAKLIRETAAGGRPVLVTGCGTSEHGALAAIEIIREAMAASGLPTGSGQRGAPVVVQAFEGSLEDELAGPGGLVIAVSHEGGTWATNQALVRAHASRANVALITVSERSPAATLADVVIATGELDESWCHTVGYLSPILAACAIAGHLTGRMVTPAAVETVLAAGLDAEAVDAVESIARRLRDVDRVIVLGSGVDRSAARELTLKIEEGTHLPAAMRELETMLHGHLAGTDARTGLVLVLVGAGRGADERERRAADVLRAGAEIGLRSAAILGERYAQIVDSPLTPAGRVVVPPAPMLPAAMAGVVGSVVPLQLLTERLARARGVDPDPIRRDDPAYRRAAETAGG